MSFARSAARRSLRRCAAAGLYYSGMLRALDRMSGSHGCVRILSYHRVGPQPDEFLPLLPLAIFERQMAHLARNCSVIGLEQAVRALGENRVPRAAVVLTFDDGYRDNLVHAFGVLKRLGLPATIFLTTGAIGTDRLIWHDRVFCAFARSHRPLQPGFIPGRASDRPDPPQDTPGVRRDVLRYLKRLDQAEREQEIARLIDLLAADVPRSKGGLMLDWDDVRTMHHEGVSFGSHTVTHPVLSKLRVDQARREIEESKHEIERQIGSQVATFAYPNGSRRDFDGTTKQILSELGFSAAVTTIYGSNRSSPDESVPDPLELKRMGLHHPELSVFAMKLALQRFKAESNADPAPGRPEATHEGA